MAQVVDFKGNQYLASDGKYLIEVVYDFADDAGAVGTLNLVQFKEAVIVTDFYTQVLTQATSGGSATLVAGVVGGDVDAFLASTAVAALTANAVFPVDAAGKGEYVAADGIIGMAIGTAALTAGKIKFFIEVIQAG